ncbi:40s ribosomal s8 [Ophiocordyceps camponoti-floridani]|uniref:40s ribosomal s8 n=1 Tax=Ophiocordyceps camponoti-floridani TaxID=2030778 RepID=A0A8H4VAV1_9HYPO|nr:40s ribosomal s8 [Ophiocordyceps camponoti-floridani]
MARYYSPATQIHAQHYQASTETSASSLMQPQHRQAFLKEPFAFEVSSTPKTANRNSPGYGPPLSHRTPIHAYPPPLKPEYSTTPTSPPSDYSFSNLEEGESANDSVSWTRSRRWMSNETKERVAFLRIMTNLRHIRAEKSPCVPQTLTELAAFKAEVADARKKTLERAVGRRQAELQLRRQPVALGEATPAVGKLFGGRQFHDGRSPVLATDNCFNQYPETGLDWPSLTELKAEADKRGGEGQYHLLPPPRPRLSSRRRFPPNPSANPAFIMPVMPELDSRHRVEELSLNELPGLLQETVWELCRCLDGA